MKIVADEGVDRQVVEQLRRENHEVIYVAELAPGISDDEVLQLANERGAVLLTADKDFGELVFRLNRTSGGIMLIRWQDCRPMRSQLSWRTPFASTVNKCTALLAS